MKKLTYVLAATLLAACNSGNNGYTITGTVEGANDGDMVYLQGVEGRQLVKLDSAVIKNGTFTFTGKQVVPAEYKHIEWCRDKKHFFCCLDDVCEMYRIEEI